MEGELKPGAKIAGNQITVVFLDRSEMKNVDNGRPGYRTVVVPLTLQQVKLLDYQPRWEHVSLCILETK